MATTDLNLENTGSLHPPGPVGRIVRLFFGILCLWYLYRLLDTWLVLIHEDVIRSVIWDGLLPALILISYVVNIGWSCSWKKYPLVISLVLFIVVGTFEQIMHGKFEGEVLANVIFWWMAYLYTHLGMSFVLSAVIATPGCEMRAFHHLFSLITGKPTKEHHCPIGPLSPIDRWESKRNHPS